MTKRNQTETDARTIRLAGYWAAMYKAQSALLWIKLEDFPQRNLRQIRHRFQELRRFAALADESPEYFIKEAISDYYEWPDEKIEQVLELFATITADEEE